MSEVKRFFVGHTMLPLYCRTDTGGDPIDTPTPAVQPNKYEVALAVAYMLIEKWVLDLRAEKVTALVLDIVAVLP